MELDKIEKLLEKYFDAVTSVSEEDTLKNYFSQDEVAEHLEVYKPMFGFYTKAKEEHFSKPLPLVERTTKSRKRRYAWLSVAAAALVLFGMYFGQRYQEERLLERQQAEYAYNETKRALGLLAENFGRGTEKVAYLNEFVEAKQKIYNQD